MSLSNITVSGTVKKDPEKRFIQTNIPITNFIIEVTYIPRGLQNGQPKEVQSHSIKINAWRDLAEQCEASIKSQDKVLVIGKAQINVYTTQDGKKKRELEIDANSVVLLKDALAIQPPAKKEESSENTYRKSASNVDETSNLEEVLAATEEIPF